MHKSKKRNKELMQNTLKNQRNKHNEYAKTPPLHQTQRVLQLV